MVKPTIFIATPIAGFTNEKEYSNFRNKIKALDRRISRRFVVYAEILKIHGFSSYDTPYKAATEDFGNIEKSTYFVLIYPQKLPSSALVELGFALAQKKRILILTTSQEILPYMVQEIDKVYSNVKISYLSENWIGIDDRIQDFVLNG